MKFTAKLQGMERLDAAFSGLIKGNGLPQRLENGARTVCDAAAGNLSKAQQADSRMETLAQSLRVTHGGDGPFSSSEAVEQQGLCFTISTPLDYGWHLEFGSLRRVATPWLAPALETARPGILASVREWLASSVKGTAGA